MKTIKAFAIVKKKEDEILRYSYEPLLIFPSKELAESYVKGRLGFEYSIISIKIIPQKRKGKYENRKNK